MSDMPRSPNPGGREQRAHSAKNKSRLGGLAPGENLKERQVRLVNFFYQVK